MPLLKHPVGPAVVNVSERRAEVLRERGWTDPYDETEEVADEAEAVESVDPDEAEVLHEEEVAAQAEIEAEVLEANAANVAAQPTSPPESPAKKPSKSAKAK